MKTKNGGLAAEFDAKGEIEYARAAAN
jgi:hypothetical protein